MNKKKTIGKGYADYGQGPLTKWTEAENCSDCGEPLEEEEIATSLCAKCNRKYKQEYESDT